MRSRGSKVIGLALGVVASIALMVPSVASAAPATHFEFTVPTTVTPGVPFTFSVTAVDGTGTVDTSYAGTVTFSSDDPTASLPAPQTLTMGTKTFTNGATLSTPGCHRITASDGLLATSSPLIAVGGCNVVDSETGSLTGLDPTQTGRLAYTPPAGQCNTTLTPALASATGARAYDSYTHTNLTNDPICFTVDVSPGAPECDDGAISNATYLGSFNPANPLTNYLSDPGTSSGEGGQFVSHSFTVPAGASFVDVVHATEPGGLCSSYVYVLTSSKPFANSLPAAVGSATVGSILGWQTGNWTDAPSFSYQWRRCDAGGGNCVNIPGATAGTYEVTAADVGSTLRIRVFATDASGTSSADSPQTAVVPPQVAVTPAVTITGQRARAIRRCKKKFPKGSIKRKKCIRRARRLPV